MVRIGKIVAVHGLLGNVILKHITGRSDWLKEKYILFVELNKGSYIPFFVQHATAANDEEYIAALEDVHTVQEARKLIGKQVYVEQKILAGHEKDSPLLWIGFNVVDKHLGSLGAIEDVMETGAQWLGKISYKEKEVLLPLVKQMIIEVNTKNKFIRMDLPEGLLDIYTG